MNGLDLAGLTTGPAQTWGSVRLVPLLRAKPIEDLRLDAHLYGEALTAVVLAPRHYYAAYVPHAFVATWSGEEAAAAYGTQLEPAGVRDPRTVPLRFRRRMARRVDRNRLRFLPLHLALEGYLALHFGGPTVAWAEWSSRAIRQGLSPRAEESYAGAEVADLPDALRIFEIHPGQCGVLVYVADALASAFVVPHPDDYRALHATLVQDLYGELLYQYGLLTLAAHDFRARIDETAVGSLAALRGAAGAAREEWAAFHDSAMAGGLLSARCSAPPNEAADYSFERVRDLGPFTLWRFLPSFRLTEENHIGETITDASGRLAYLKTYRLSQGQVRRGHLLSRIAACDWNLEAAAADLGADLAGLTQRLERAGFGHLLRQDVLDHYRAARRRG